MQATQSGTGIQECVLVNRVDSYPDKSTGRSHKVFESKGDSWLGDVPQMEVKASKWDLGDKDSWD